MAAPTKIQIQLDDPSTSIESFAEEELQTYIDRVLGPRALARQRTPSREAIAINVGAAARRRLASHSKTLSQRLGRLAPEGFVATIIDGDIVIAGRDDIGTLRGTHAVIERLLGVRWFFVNEEIADKMSMAQFRARLRVMRPIVEQPSFRDRQLQAPATIDWVDWMARNRVNVINLGYMAPSSQQWASFKPLIGEIHRRGLKISITGHCFMAFLRPQRYFSRYPQWFALVGGQRTNRRRQTFCTSNRAAMACFLENWRRYVKTVKTVDQFDLWPEDGSVWCECAKCSRDPAADRHVCLVNEMARVLWSVDSKKSFSLFAYGTHQEPPPRARLDAGIKVVFCWWGRDYALAYNHRNCAVHNDLRYLDAGHRACCVHFGRFRQWREKFGSTNEFLIFDQHMQQGIRGPHLMPLPIMDQDMQWFKRIGLKGLVQSSNVHDDQWVTGLNRYVAVRKVWNESTATESLLHDFFDRYYERARQPMRRCYEQISQGFPHWRRTYHATHRKARNFNMYGTWSFKPQRRYPQDLKPYNDHALKALANCRRLLALARRSERQTLVMQRLKKVQIYLDYLEACRQSIDKQMEAVDQMEQAVNMDAESAAASMEQAARLYRQALDLEKQAKHLTHQHEGQGLFWDGYFWKQTSWHGQSRVRVFPGGITEFSAPDGDQQVQSV